MSASERGDLATIWRRLKTGIAVDSGDNAGRTALLAAAHANRVEVARVQIGAGADVNVEDRIQDSPYLYAVAEGRNEILKMTLAAGADRRSVNRYGGTALIPAALHGHPDAVKILFGAAIDKDHVNRLGWIALLLAVAVRCTPKPPVPCLMRDPTSTSRTVTASRRFGMRANAASRR